MPTDEALLEKLRADFKLIDRDLLSLVWTRQYYQELLEIVTSNALVNRPSGFFSYLAHTHAQTLLIGIRRQVDRDTRSASLAGVVEQLRSAPHLARREAHLRLYDEGQEEIAVQTWRNLTGSDDEEHPTAIFQRHLESIDAIRGSIGTFATKRIAHLDRDAQPPSGSFAEMWDAVDRMQEIFSHYVLLLTAVDHRRKRIVLDPGWREVFRTPWITRQES